MEGSARARGSPTAHPRRGSASASYMTAPLPHLGTPRPSPTAQLRARRWAPPPAREAPPATRSRNPCPGAPTEISIQTPAPRLHTTPSAAIGRLPEGSWHRAPALSPAPPPPTAPRRAPALPPGLDLPLRVQRSQARATRATTPPGMHLRPPRTAACHSHGHPRGSPSAAQPPAPQGGRDSAAWVCRFPSCVGCAGRDRCARGRAGVAGVAAVAARDPARPRRSARARPRASGADLEPKPQRRPAQGP